MLRLLARGLSNRAIGARAVHLRDHGEVPRRQPDAQADGVAPGRGRVRGDEARPAVRPTGTPACASTPNARGGSARQLLADLLVLAWVVAACVRRAGGEGLRRPAAAARPERWPTPASRCAARSTARRRRRPGSRSSATTWPGRWASAPGRARRLTAAGQQTVEGIATLALGVGDRDHRRSPRCRCARVADAAGALRAGPRDRRPRQGPRPRPARPARAGPPAHAAAARVAADPAVVVAARRPRRRARPRADRAARAGLARPTPRRPGLSAAPGDRREPAAACRSRVTAAVPTSAAAEQPRHPAAMRARPGGPEEPRERGTSGGRTGQRVVARAGHLHVLQLRARPVGAGARAVRGTGSPARWGRGRRGRRAAGP